MTRSHDGALNKSLHHCVLCRILLEETLSAWLAARPALAHPASQRVGVYVGCMYHEYLTITAAASGGKPPPQVSEACLKGRPSDQPQWC